MLFKDLDKSTHLALIITNRDTGTITIYDENDSNATPIVIIENVIFEKYKKTGKYWDNTTVFDGQYEHFYQDGFNRLIQRFSDGTETIATWNDPWDGTNSNTGSLVGESLGVRTSYKIQKVVL